MYIHIYIEYIYLSIYLSIYLYIHTYAYAFICTKPSSIGRGPVWRGFRPIG